VSAVSQAANKLFRTGIRNMSDVAQTVTSVLTVFLGVVAGISLIVEGMGIKNIMLVSVTERTLEGMS
jgi:putative ABC transport system permease protein